MALPTGPSQPPPELRCGGAGLQLHIQLRYSHVCAQPRAALTYAWSSCLHLSPALPPWRCLPVTRLHLAPFTATGPDPDLQIDFPASPQTCLLVTSVSDDLDSRRTPAAIPGLALPGCCGAGPRHLRVVFGSWLLAPQGAAGPHWSLPNNNALLHMFIYL